MRLLFLDTSAWAAALLPREEEHEVAARAYASALEEGLRFATTHFVIAELHALSLRRMGHVRAAKVLAAALDPLSKMIVPVETAMIDEAVDRWIRRYKDHDISLADAVSFEVMRREGIDTAFTLDHHFKIAGYRTVPQLS